MLWAWCWDVCVFRILARKHIFLHGVAPLGQIDTEKLSNTIDGHILAAERLASQFAPSRERSTASSGYGRYCALLATTSTSNTNKVECADHLQDSQVLHASL